MLAKHQRTIQEFKYHHNLLLLLFSKPYKSHNQAMLAQFFYHDTLSRMNIHEEGFSETRIDEMNLRVALSKWLISSKHIKVSPVPVLPALG